MTLTPDLALQLRNARIAAHPGLNGLPSPWKSLLTRQTEADCKHFLLPETVDSIINASIADFRANHNPYNLDLTASDSELGDAARRHAERAALLLAGTQDADTKQAIIGQVCRAAHLPEPTGDSIASRVKRLSCPRWWRCKLRRQHARVLEDGNIRLNLVQAKRDPYASRDALLRCQRQEARNGLFMQNTILQNECGDSFTLQELSEKSTSNKAIRRNELMTRLRGMEDIAAQRGDIALFGTITCPSSYHATVKESGKGNAAYRGHTPRQANAYLCEVWSRIRAKLQREGIEVYGLRVAEPHHDACPHWHLILFVAPHQSELLQSVMRHYALAVNPEEPGAAKNRCHFVTIAAEKGSATGYIAKYIAKNIDGYKLETDLMGEPILTTSLRVTAWAKTHGIRQFQEFGTVSVMLWREMRRIKQQAIADAPAYVQEAWQSAQKTLTAEGDTEQRADYARFINAVGGVAISRKDARIKLAKLHYDTPGRYGDAIGEKPVGIVDAAAPMKVYESTRYTWTQIDAKATPASKSNAPASAAANACEIDTSGFAQAREVLKKSVFAVPWTRVNNCTQEGGQETPVMLEWIDKIPPLPCEAEENPPNHWFEDDEMPDLPDWMNEAPPMPTEAGDVPPMPDWVDEREQWFEV
jgi:hypothetical protein